MAGDWIPITTDLFRRREVLVISSQLDCSTHEVVGLLAEFWGWVSAETADGELPGLTLDSLGKSGRFRVDFLRAMVVAKWLQEKDCGLFVPNFDRWLSSGAKQRLQAGRRQGRHRARIRDAANNSAPEKCKIAAKESMNNSNAFVTLEALPEKSREENRREEPPTPLAGGTSTKKPPTDPALTVPIPATLDTPEFRAIWNEWIADRKTRRKPLTGRAASLQLTGLATLPVASAIECVRASLANGWTGVFPERFQGKTTAQKPPHNFDRAAAQEARMIAQIREAMEQP